MGPAVWTFFYGSYINFDVLREVDLVPAAWQVASLPGYDLRIRPRANLVPSDQHSVYGIVATATHEELARLYEHARGVLGEVYHPHAVLAKTKTGALLPALCYLSHGMVERPAADDYIDRIAEPARSLGFPDWYVERIERFRDTTRRRSI